MEDIGSLTATVAILSKSQRFQFLIATTVVDDIISTSVRHFMVSERATKEMLLL